MCGRFTLRLPPNKLKQYFGLVKIDQIVPRTSIAPTELISVIRRGWDGNYHSMMRWGLIPSWSKDRSNTSPLINARSETLGDKPAFREAVRLRRCLIPADGFFEWKKIGAAKQPYQFGLDGEEPFGIAGIWETWNDPATGETIESCSIVTTPANALVKPIHDRMPAILPRFHWESWLNSNLTDPRDLKLLLQPYPAEEMRMRPAMNLFGNSKNRERSLFSS